MDPAISLQAWDTPERMQRRLTVGLAVSLALHALLLSLQFGVPGLGLPGLEMPWNQRRAQSTDLTVVLAPPPPVQPASPVIPAPDTNAPQPEPLPIPSASEAAAPEPQHPARFQLYSPRQSVPPATPKAVAKAKAKHKPAKPARPKPAPPIIARKDAESEFIIPEQTPAEPDNTPAPVAKAAENAIEAPGPIVVDTAAAERAAEEAERRAEEQRIAQETAARKAIEEREAREAQKAEQKRRAEETARLAAEREQRQREEMARQAAIAREQQDAERKHTEEAARLAREAEERRVEEAKRLEAARAQREAIELEAKRRAEENARRLEVENAKRQAEENARRLAALAQQEALRKEQEEAIRRAQEEARRQAELKKLEEQRQAQELAHRQAEEAAARAQAEELARKRAAEELAARQRAEELAARRKAEADAAAKREQERMAAASQAGNQPGGAARGTEGDRILQGTLPRGTTGGDLAARALNQLRSLDAPRLDTQPSRPSADAEDTSRRASILGRAPQDVGLAMYVEGWRLKIERMGRLNYTQSAVDKSLVDAIVTVVIRSDGSVQEILFHRNTGRKELDDAIRRIIRLNERYASFPPDLARRYDTIEIRRVWNFEDKLRILEEMKY